jgi:hypothetical protein
MAYHRWDDNGRRADGADASEPRRDQGIAAISLQPTRIEHLRGCHDSGDAPKGLAQTPPPRYIADIGAWRSDEKLRRDADSGRARGSRRPQCGGFEFIGFAAGLADVGR